jgi:putative hydrolase of the HAD superfamily
MISAVFWDFGGVITTSPFEAFNRYEAEHGLPADFIRSVNATNPDSNAWAQFESSRVSLEAFDGLFAAETQAAGHRVPGADVLQLLSGDVRPEMVHALALIGERFTMGCLTNNVKGAGQGPGMAADSQRAAEIAGIMEMFDFVIESSKVGFRKPDTRMYELACEKAGVSPPQAVFLDDLGINLKPARAMGMTTIKVLSADQALDDLGSVLGMDLRAPA